MEKKTDTESLKHYIDDIAYGYLKKEHYQNESLDPILQKAISLSQLSVQYILACNNSLVTRYQTIKKAAKPLVEKLDDIDLEMTRLRYIFLLRVNYCIIKCYLLYSAKKKALKRECRDYDNTIESYINILRDLDPELANKFLKEDSSSAMKIKKQELPNNIAKIADCKNIEIKSEIEIDSDNDRTSKAKEVTTSSEEASKGNYLLQTTDYQELHPIIDNSHEESIVRQSEDNFNLPDKLHEKIYPKRVFVRESIQSIQSQGAFSNTGMSMDSLNREAFIEDAVSRNMDLDDSEILQGNERIDSEVINKSEEQSDNRNSINEVKAFVATNVGNISNSFGNLSESEIVNLSLSQNNILDSQRSDSSILFVSKDETSQSILRDVASSLSEIKDYEQQSKIEELEVQKYSEEEFEDYENDFEEMESEALTFDGKINESHVGSKDHLEKDSGIFDFTESELLQSMAYDQQSQEFLERSDISTPFRHVDNINLLSEETNYFSSNPLTATSDVVLMATVGGADYEKSNNSEVSDDYFQNDDTSSNNDISMSMDANKMEVDDVSVESLFVWNLGRASTDDIEGGQALDILVSTISLSSVDKDDKWKYFLRFEFINSLSSKSDNILQEENLSFSSRKSLYIS